MASRHQRRKRAADRRMLELTALASRARSIAIAEIVRINKASPIERTYNYGKDSTLKCAEAMPRAIGGHKRTYFVR